MRGLYLYLSFLVFSQIILSLCLCIIPVQALRFVFSVKPTLTTPSLFLALDIFLGRLVLRCMLKINTHIYGVSATFLERLIWIYKTLFF
ncbi:expressed protein [Phakopsora pachyrhizi]|uniref:Expressed protein n=1 Tax=Phakopsora pachyrhizi TaxID=170000 RepID=A0AAV0BEG4_PHAPC|nr:expressed protein [Phakopsora pachyrhizi]